MPRPRRLTRKSLKTRWVSLKEVPQMSQDALDQYISSLLKYDPITGVFTWAPPTSTRRGVKAHSIAGTKMTNGSIQITFDNRRYMAHELAMFYTHRVWPSRRVRHINGDHSDNRISNLTTEPATKTKPELPSFLK